MSDAHADNALTTDAPSTQLYECIEVYFSYNSFTLYPSTKIKAIDNPELVLRGKGVKPLSFDACLLLSLQLRYHPDAGSIKVFESFPQYGKQARVETHSSSLGFGTYEVLNSDLCDKLNFSIQEVLTEIQDYFNPAIRPKTMGSSGRIEKWVTLPVRLAEDYTEEMIQDDLRICANLDKNLKSVIDLPGIVTTADAEQDRSYIYAAAREAKARLVATGNYPKVA